jgi:hypothetical protein
MKNVRRFLHPVILIMVTGCTSIVDVPRKLTMAQANQNIREIAIPALEKDVAMLKAFRFNPPTPQTGDLWGELDRQTDTATGKAPLLRVTSPKDNTEMAIVTIWMRWRILSKNADFRYSYVHASNLYRTKEPSSAIQKEAVYFFFHARLALRIDGAHCVDQSSPQSIGLRYETNEYLRQLHAYIAAMPKKAVANAILNAAAIEEIRDERPLMRDLCTQGTRTMLRALQSGVQPEPISPTDPRAPDLPGRNFAVDVSKFEPEVISHDAWLTRRREIIDSFIQQAIDLL